MDQRRGTNRPQPGRTALAVITFSNYDLDAGRDSVVFAFKSARQRHRINSTIPPPTRNDGNRTRAAPGTLRVCSSRILGYWGTGLLYAQNSWGPIYKMSYDLSYDYRKFIVRSTYDSDLKRAEIFLRNIVS